MNIWGYKQQIYEIKLRIRTLRSERGHDYEIKKLQEKISDLQFKIKKLREKRPKIKRPFRRKRTL